LNSVAVLQCCSSKYTPWEGWKEFLYYIYIYIYIYI